MKKNISIALIALLLSAIAYSYQAISFTPAETVIIRKMNRLIAGQRAILENQRIAKCWLILMLIDMGLLSPLDLPPGTPEHIKGGLLKSVQQGLQ